MCVLWIYDGEVCAQVLLFSALLCCISSAVLLSTHRDAKTKPLYMDPHEVERHISQLCRNESGILRHIYGGAEPSTHGGVSSMQRRGQESVRRAAQTDPARLYKSFFIRALAVPPNRYVMRAS